MQSWSSAALVDAFDVFLADMQARRYTPATVQHYKDYLTPLLRWLETEQVYVLAELTPTHLRRYLADLSARNLAG